MTADTNDEKLGNTTPLNTRLTDAATTILAPLRVATLVAIGGTVLLAEAVQRRLTHAAGESERQLDLFAKSIRRTTGRLWFRQRRGPRAATSPGSSRRAAI
jgi:hypothetical protein